MASSPRFALSHTRNGRPGHLSTRSHARPVEYRLDLLARPGAEGKGRTADGRRYRHTEDVHGELDGPERGVAQAAERQQRENAAVPLGRLLQLPVLGATHQADEEFGGDVGQAADGPVAPGEDGGEDQIL